MMTRDRGQRFASAESVAQALHSWLEEPDVDSSRLRTDGEPVSLEDPKRLRDELVRLQVLSREDWDRAEQGALQRRVPSFDPVSSSVLLDRPPPLQSTHVLEELYRQPGTDEQSSHGLSEFQIQYVLNGDQDLLRLPHHVLLDQVGAGWKGDVFKARNVELNRLEALRVFSPQVLEGLEGTERERVTAFLAFVDRLAALEHPAIPRVYGGGRWQNRRRGRQVYFSTHFVHGLTLHDLVQARVLPGGEPVDLAWSVHTAREVCYALEYAHQRGILHLDVHGLTLKLDSTGRVQLLDLGVALLLTRRMPLTAEAAMPKRRLRASALPDLPSAPAASFDADLRATMSVEPPPMGTPTVMPPEQWKNRSSVSPATDVYNLGCTLFFMLTGQYPFRATNALESMRQHLEKPPLEDPLAQRIPQPLHPILNRALAKAPEKRFSSAQAFGAALDEYIAGHAVSGQSGTQVSPSWLSRLQDWFVNRPR
jgi:serine/threonine protein kinase